MSVFSPLPLFLDDPVSQSVRTIVMGMDNAIFITVVLVFQAGRGEPLIAL
jgi:hypothetical protein